MKTLRQHPFCPALHYNLPLCAQNPPLGQAKPRSQQHTGARGYIRWKVTIKGPSSPIATTVQQLLVRTLERPRTAEEFRLPHLNCGRLFGRLWPRCKATNALGHASVTNMSVRRKHRALDRPALLPLPAASGGQRLPRGLRPFSGSGVGP